MYSGIKNAYLDFAWKANQGTEEASFHFKWADSARQFYNMIEDNNHIKQVSRTGKRVDVEYCSNK